MEVIRKVIRDQKEFLFDVTEPRLSFAGYTVYRLQLKVLDGQGAVSSIEFLGWKRFNDFKKLHKQLKAGFPHIFEQGFKDFVKGKFFGRFDESVIEERRQASCKLLSFIAFHPNMFAHKAFINFIEPSQSQSPRDKTSSFSSIDDTCEEISDVLDAPPVNTSERSAAVEEFTTDDVERMVNMRVEEVESDDNVDEVFIRVQGECDNNGGEGGTDDGAVGAIGGTDSEQTWLREARSLCGEDLECLASQAEDELPITPRLDSNDDANESVLFGEPLDDDIICASPGTQNKIQMDESSIEMTTKGKETTNDSLETVPQQTQHENNPDKNENQSGSEINSKDENKTSINKVVASDSNNESNDNDDNNINHPSTENQSDKEHTINEAEAENRSNANSNNDNMRIPGPFRVDEKMSAVISRTVENDDYVFQASVAMSTAIEEEASGNIEKAFKMYRFGIGLLLRGVQTDEDVERREAVRRKTAQYLLRAEELYQSTLERKKQGKNEERFNAVGKSTEDTNSEISMTTKNEISTDSQCEENRNLNTCKSIERSSYNTVKSTEPKYIQSQHSTLSGSLKECKRRFQLNDVKVIGVIDKVMLVQKKHNMEDVFVMKVLHKQGAEYKRSNSIKSSAKKKTSRNLYNCKFMTRLLNCVETKTGIYLLLEHVPGGKLWDYLGLPLFSSRHGSTSSGHSVSDIHHSWNNATDYNSSFTDHKTTNDVDIVDIPPRSYVAQGSKDLSKIGSVSSPNHFKMKRSRSKSATIDEGSVKTWAAQISLTLMYLHSKGVICKDLNPRNILVDAEGNVKLTYFSHVDSIDYSLDQNAVNGLYTSPEVDHVFEPTSATDWWSFGAILFELLTGESLHNCHPYGINERSVITLPKRVSNEACALLAGLLKYNPKERLGGGPTGNEEIKAQPFFHGIDWESLSKGKY